MFKPREIHNFTQGDACVSFNCLQIKKTSEEIPDKPSEREEGREEVSERDKTQLQNFTSSVNIHVESHRWILIGCLCCLTLKTSAPVVPRYSRQHLNFFFLLCFAWETPGGKKNTCCGFKYEGLKKTRSTTHKHPFWIFISASGSFQGLFAFSVVISSETHDRSSQTRPIMCFGAQTDALSSG